MKITIIGAGNVGQALAKGWSRAGHAIIFGVQTPIDAARADQLKAIAPHITVHSVAESVKDGDVIVLAVPWDAVPDALAACGDLGGRILIDATNPLKFEDGKLSLTMGFDCSGGEEVARMAKGACVYKAMNQVGFNVMADAHGYATPPTMFIAGDDAEHKPVVLRLVADLGFAALDVGPLSLARLLEPYAMLWIHMATSGRAPMDAAFALQLGKECIA